jgi:hypothetical protein
VLQPFEYEITVTDEVPSVIDPLVTIPPIPVVTTVATVELLLLHVPPKEGSLSVMITPPEHILAGPVIGNGKGITVTVMTGDAQPLE